MNKKGLQDFIKKSLSFVDVFSWISEYRQC